MPGGITYRELTKLIEQLSSKKISGTLFLRTEDNHSGMLMFSAGAVIGLTYGVNRGVRAIEELRNAEKGSRFTYRFQEGRPPPIRQDLKSPEETLMALGVAVENPLSLEAEPAPAAPPEPEPEPAVEPAPAAQPSAEEKATGALEMDGLIRNILGEEMSAHLGPAAPLMVADAEDGAGGLTSRRQIEQVLEALCQDLETGEQEDFKRAIRERTSSLFTKTACTLVTGELNEYLGPVASSLCDEQIQQMGGGITSPEELQQLVNALAQEIDDPGEAEHFVAQVEQGLRELSA